MSEPLGDFMNRSLLCTRACFYNPLTLKSHIHRNMPSEPGFATRQHVHCRPRQAQHLSIPTFCKCTTAPCGLHRVGPTLWAAVAGRETWS